MESKHSQGELVIGGSLTGPTTPSVQPFCAKDWPHTSLQIGYETIAVCPAQTRERVPGVIGKPVKGSDRANAERLALCWNTHEELVAVCKTMLGELEALQRWHPAGHIECAIADAREVLAKARP